MLELMQDLALDRTPLNRRISLRKLDSNRPAHPMLAVLTSVPALSTGFGLSPSSCLLPHHSTHGPAVHESDLLLSNGRLHDPRAALLRAPVQNSTATGLTSACEATQGVPGDHGALRAARAAGVHTDSSVR